MNTLPPSTVTLSTDRPGIRTSLAVDIRTPPCELIENPANPAVLDFISSDATLDRYHESIEPTGWKLDSYLRNPVFQNAHQYGDVIFTLGRALITQIWTPGSPLPAPCSDHPAPCLFQRIQFAVDANPIAKIAYTLYRGKFLNAVSVGFIPLRWTDGGDARSQSSSSSSSSRAPAIPNLSTDLAAIENQKSKIKNPQQFRRKYLEQELLEVSAVSIPANPNALALAVKSGAIDKSDLRDTLDLLQSTLSRSDAPTLSRSDAPTSLLTLARLVNAIMKRT